MSSIDPLVALQEKTGVSWSHLAAARTLSGETRALLDSALREQVPSDTSVVVFGSLARGEYTRGSDLDWTLLIDGQADPGHYVQVQEISRILRDAHYHEPGPSGLFGNIAFSHPILHQLGGQDDTNKNTTQRILLLLESAAIGNPDAHERVLRLILARYVEDDRGIRYGQKRYLVPRILLNDIVRYWRTMTVDFVAKQRERTTGWALRNIKLRLSRKLIFVSGLLCCFSCELFADDTVLGSAGTHVDPPLLVRFLRDRIRLTPLESLAQALLRPAISAATACLVFDAYDGFVGLLADDDKRDHLKKLPVDALGNDPVFREAGGYGKKFQDGLDQLFFSEDPVMFDLIRKYGVF